MMLQSDMDIPNFNDSMVERIFLMADKNNDNQMTFDEFLPMMQDFFVELSIFKQNNKGKRMSMVNQMKHCDQPTSSRRQAAPRESTPPRARPREQRRPSP